MTQEVPGLLHFALPGIIFLPVFWAAGGPLEPFPGTVGTCLHSLLLFLFCSQRECLDAVKLGEDLGLVSTWGLPRPGGALSPVLCAATRLLPTCAPSSTMSALLCTFLGQLSERSPPQELREGCGAVSGVGLMGEAS